MKLRVSPSRFVRCAFALVLAACTGEVSDARTVCAAAGSFAIAAHARSRVVGTRIEAGPLVACESNPRPYRAAVSALSRAPAALRPARVVLHLLPELEPAAPALRGVETHRASGELLVGSQPGDELSASELTLWLHELAHVRARGARPSSPVPARLVGALEEGVADYFAAAVAGSSRVGVSGVELRDLELPPALRASEWAALAVPGAFDAHRFGWVLAAGLYRNEPRAGALLEDTLSTLARSDAWPANATTPRGAVAELLRRCPERSRNAFDQALLRWLPPELYQG